MTPLDFKKVGPGTCWNELRSDNLLAVPNLIEKVHAAARAIESLRQQLAECQATNGKLRNSLNKFGEHTHTRDCVVDGEIPENEDEHDVCTCGFSKALAIPNDATALNELIAERTASLTAEVERQREQLFHIVKECDASATQSKRILRIKARAESTLSGDAPDFSSVKDRREDKIRHIGQLNYLNDQLRQQNAELTAEVERLRLFDNLAKEYGLSVFADITELTAQRDEAMLTLENCRLLAARNRNEDWAKNILRFCSEIGVNGNPLRTDAAIATWQGSGIP